MMTINLVCVGNLKETFWVDAQKEYIKRLSRFCKFNIIEVEEQNKLSSISEILSREGEEVLSKSRGKMILFDIKGKEISSEDLASLIEKLSLSSSTLTFVIGGSYGVSEPVKQRADERISFGKITLAHNLARIVALEQIYRAFNILAGTSYHK